MNTTALLVAPFVTGWMTRNRPANGRSGHLQMGGTFCTLFGAVFAAGLERQFEIPPKTQLMGQDQRLLSLGEKL